MKNILWIGAIVLGASLACPALLAKDNAVSVNAIPAVAHVLSSGDSGSAGIGTKQCLNCHSDEGQSFARSPHAALIADCEQCHGGGSLHVADENSGHIHGFKDEEPKVSNALCLNCHDHQHSTHGWESSVHARADVRCVDCHQVHQTGSAAHPSKSPDQMCVRCHIRQAAEMNLPYHHPVREGKMGCVDCHDPHNENGSGGRLTSRNQRCYQCHPEYQGPFAYQHPPVTEDCLKCHNPHGSANAHLLQVSEPFLCLQCHSGHHNGSGVPLLNACTSCHTSIHGTDVPSATGGSVFIDKSSTEPGSLASSTTKGSSMRTATAALSYGMPAGVGVAAFTENGMSAGQTDYSLQFTPAYHYLSVSGYGGRVGEYDSLRRDSLGGNLGVRMTNQGSRTYLNLGASMINSDDYKIKGEARIGEILSVQADAGSLIHNLDATPFGVNRSPDDIQRDELIAPGTVLPIKRTFVNAKARLQIPDSPISFFLRAGMQSRSGVCPAQYYDMGSNQDCSACHSVSTVRNVRYDTQDISGGFNLDLGPALITYEHARRTSENREPGPVDVYGSTLSVPNDQLPAGVADSLAGIYLDGVEAGHVTDSDTLSLKLRPVSSVTFDGTVTAGRTRNSFTENAQKYLNADDTLNWDACARIETGLDFHEQDTVNDFTPFYSLYGNPDMHRLWGGAHIDYKLTDGIGIETYYRYNQVKRSNSNLWPQFYSPDNSDSLYVVPRTTANTVGAALKLHKGSFWKMRAGYEWIDTHDPGYETDPGRAYRVLAHGGVSPLTWLSIDDDATATIQSHFANVDRQNHLYTNTTSLVLTPKPDWSITVSYAYFRNDLKSDLVFMNDPSVPVLYQQSLVPYSASTQALVISSNANLTKKLHWNLDFMSSSSTGSFSPDPNVAPDPYSYSSVALAANFSQVEIRQLSVRSMLRYPVGTHCECGVGGQYGSYRDLVHTELNGHLLGVLLELSVMY